MPTWIAHSGVRSRSTNDKPIHVILSLRRSISAIDTQNSSSPSSNLTRPSGITEISYRLIPKFAYIGYCFPHTGCLSVRKGWC